VSNDPSWFVCKMCDFAEHCHGEKAPAVNCRTCAHSTPMTGSDGGEWHCAKMEEAQCDESIDDETMRKGCHDHRYIPILLERFATMKDVVDGEVVYTTEHGDFANGEHPASFTSQEIRDMDQKVMLADAAKLKAELVEQGFFSKVVS
jgi:hypothetical protein